VKPETKFYQELKKKFKDFQLTRIENISVPGVPDLLCYNKNHFFFTLELKVTTSNKIRLSPHQISFHIRHPLNSFILVKPLASSDVKLYEGQQVEALAARGLLLEPLETGLAACGLLLAELGGWAQLEA
jgi:Holliday junction resolvase